MYLLGFKATLVRWSCSGASNSSAGPVLQVYFIFIKRTDIAGRNYAHFCPYFLRAEVTGSGESISGFKLFYYYII